MKSFPLPASLFLAALLLGVPALSASGSDSTADRYKFSDPAKPGVIRITLAVGDLVVSGADTDTVTITTDIGAAKPATRADGMRVLTETATLAVNEKNNILTLDAGLDSGIGHVALNVPRSTSVIVTQRLGGAVSLSNLAGDIEIKTLNGEVTLREISGGALVETMNGSIEARMSRVQEGKPLAFTSMNGAIALWVPTDSKANVRLRTQHGAILTDFDENALVTRTESLRSYRYTFTSGDNTEIKEAVREAVRLGVEAAREAAEAMREAAQAAREAAQEARTGEDPRAPRLPRLPAPPLPPMTGGKLVSGALNQGGGEIHATAMNGDITLRRLD